MKKRNLKIKNESVKWYKENRELYLKFSKRVENIIRDVLEAEHIPFHSVNSRAKEVDSFEKKANTDKYDDPINQIKDFSGIRVITYVEADVKKVCEVIEKNFEIDREHFNDKSDNKFGYRSIHYVASLPENRLNFPELRIYKGLFFEVQIRTILQHAWAEIEHDRNYKIHGVLPEQDDIKNRFAVLSGILKMVDTEFDSLVKDIDNYKTSVETNTKGGNLDILIDSISINEFMTNKFTKEIKEGGVEANFGYGHTGNGESIAISELKNFGIETLKQLDTIIPEDFKNKARKEFEDGNFIGLIRKFMMIKDIKRYFEHSWNNSWTSTDSESVVTLINYGIEYEDLFERNGIKIVDSYNLNDYENDMNEDIDV
ncbi:MULTISPECIES: GTP pyrophosphokinase [Paenibacillus]|uniref:PpGpp synthetase/RelA/SpoT-type nucleotidyltransferase n=1 Tax=Paenibacillus pabuli TaxID=1472 RepID=A0A855Y053_9BACL|nr:MULTISPECIES: RelA/SpoT domain-containing protein [Paenibacillus]PWW31605.1 ppGpp synthetase/RelA/SpoT-type nucleotidyltransferase [Paenibacillus pabuli]PXW11849.1 ppGpp synthetase/RelA/SpoT-type nucleotidyltransferase [Paenibacillus taichungensis]